MKQPHFLRAGAFFALFLFFSFHLLAQGGPIPSSVGGDGISVKGTISKEDYAAIQKILAGEPKGSYLLSAKTLDKKGKAVGAAKKEGTLKMSDVKQTVRLSKPLKGGEAMTDIIVIIKTSGLQMSKAKIDQINQILKKYQ